MIKGLVIAVISIIIFIIGYIFVYNYLNSTDLTIKTKNTASYTIINGEDVLYGSQTQDTTTIRVPKYSTLTIKFTGESNYETNKQTVYIKDSPKSVEVSPYFSKKHLASLVVNSKQAIINTVTNYNAAISNDYNIEDVRLYHFGEWASANLIWKGEYGQNTDTLKVILKKDNNKWSVIGEPSIILFKKNNPSIPIDILRSVNNSSS